MTICDLRERQDFVDIVADRVWRAFWKEQGHPLSLLRDLVQKSLGDDPIPTTFVAYAGDHFLGTVSLIACDEETRPQYTPWIAALWVEPDHRARGIGEALVETAFRSAWGESFPRAYLLSREKRQAFYEKRGWVVRERNIPKPGMNILIRDKARAQSPSPEPPRR
ncbi:GNAT family N-acetyltransferase [Microvirga puerhi]|uniref:GNAT family N-acetyltransferase n=1 Tax=Microvirga puerhi TaxID=2876078 RepID=A0ABS7VV10_9HYPH|nr:GNAT family N-acetyltransferase [Microvirga puerhi]MBZ6078787.1 GNAT family N-acetyltransferase [Microvirga puerhi]